MEHQHYGPSALGQHPGGGLLAALPDVDPARLSITGASGDWTRNTPREEFPAIQNIYRLFGAAQNVSEVQIDSPHNYNKQSREAVYAFLNERVLGGNGPVKELVFSVGATAGCHRAVWQDSSGERDRRGAVCGR